MSLRRFARERAVELLFQAERSGLGIADLAPHYWRGVKASKKAKAFAEGLACGALECQPDLDALLQSCLLKWDVKRLNGVDRAILRIASFELKHRPDVPPAVAINEAVEIAKRFSGEDSRAFVNGVLDAVRAALARTPA